MKFIQPIGNPFMLAMPVERIFDGDLIEHDAYQRLRLGAPKGFHFEVIVDLLALAG